ncbi:hypothetical protein PR202_ga03856 [Eleusine coracana subsp. coracana]|uniref:Uncharacterized protein n=1 Tax=Eleusine coracana subsp. coracana TaxID=191504 RepID=A0AAV5BQ93_ELECO|nr:hypothetical protein PR202_ga03856 [Eleusine coracana subsp. coracana]
MAALSPQPTNGSFDKWWRMVDTTVSNSTRRGLNSLISLGAWTLWRHHNECVFNGSTPNLATALIMAGEETWLWSMAGAKIADRP